MIAIGTDYTPLTLGGQWWRLLMLVFLQFGLLHLALNMWALQLNDTVADRLYGSSRYLPIYLVAGLSGSLASLLGIRASMAPTLRARYSASLAHSSHS